ncbi:tumor protein D52-like isoform X3 [Gordionus sp. m RMFG-2023]|uniref:tumor protein D52-like isoform X3 n=1 Tax=Gordionus sp. m RMFG-2023 TaxID=3053472 RepID=UPI0031FC6BFF
MAANHKKQQANSESLLEPSDFHHHTTPTSDSSFHPNTTTSISDESSAQKKEWQLELAKTEDEIQTLRSVLNAKLRHAEEIKTKLGISPIQEIRDDINQGLKNIKESTAYRRTSESIHGLTDSTVFQKTSETVKKAGETLNETLNPLLSTVSASVKSKFCDIKNSKAYKSFEDTMGDAYCSVKGKITGNAATSPIVKSGIDEDPVATLITSDK